MVPGKCSLAGAKGDKISTTKRCCPNDSCSTQPINKKRDIKATNLLMHGGGARPRSLLETCQSLKAPTPAQMMSRPRGQTDQAGANAVGDSAHPHPQPPAFPTANTCWMPRQAGPSSSSPGFPGPAMRARCRRPNHHRTGTARTRTQRGSGPFPGRHAEDLGAPHGEVGAPARPTPDRSPASPSAWARGAPREPPGLGARGDPGGSAVTNL